MKVRRAKTKVTESRIDQTYILRSRKLGGEVQQLETAVSSTNLNPKPQTPNPNPQTENSNMCVWDLRILWVYAFPGGLAVSLHAKVYAVRKEQ